VEITLKELQHVLAAHGRKTDGQFEEIHREFRAVHRRLDRIERSLNGLKARVNGHERRLKRIGRAALS
jgi:hypothetical protein